MPLRPAGHLWTGALVLLALAWLAIGHAALSNGTAARSVLITLPGLPKEVADGVRVEATTAAGEDVQVSRILSQTPAWGITRTWLSAFEVRFSPAAWAALERADVEIGGATFSFRRDELVREWAEQPSAPSGERAFRLPAGIRAGRSWLGSFDRLLNWPGDGAFLGGFFPITLLIVSGTLLLLRLQGPGEASWLARTAGLSIEAAPAAAERGVRAWALGGLLFLIVALALLEVTQPFYFTQDDNFSQFLPVLLQGGEALSQGLFPEWNPYQLLGAPTASVGIYALTYPPTYLSYFTARLLGDACLTIEVFCILHMLAGYLAAFWCGRQAGLRPALSCLASLSFVLSGYHLIAGRSWYYMTTVPE